MWSLVVDPLDFPFMRNGLLELVLLGASSGLIGPFVVQRNLTFFAHALSHTLFPGLVIAAVLGVSPLLAAVVGAGLAVALVFRLRHTRHVGEDSAVGIIFLGLFALGVVLVGWFRIKTPDVGAAVVGNVVGVGLADLLASGVLAVILLVVVGSLYRPLVLVCFDRVSARAVGLPVLVLDLVLLAAVAATAVVCVKAVGVILTVGVLVTPAAAARLWSADLRRVMLLAAVFGVLAGGVGLYVAYYVRIAPSASIVLSLGAIFAISVARHCVLWRRARPAHW